MKDKLINFVARSIVHAIFAFYFFHSLYKYIFSKKKEIVKIKSGEDLQKDYLVYIGENGELQRVVDINPYSLKILVENGLSLKKMIIERKKIDYKWKIN